MALFQIPWPAEELSFSMTVSLSDVPYTLTATWIEAPTFSDTEERTVKVGSVLELSDGAFLELSDGAVLGGTEWVTMQVPLNETQSGWVIELATDDGTVIESGIRLTSGMQLAWRGATGVEPVGTLALTTLGDTPLPDLASVEDMQSGNVVLVYDDAV